MHEWWKPSQECVFISLRTYTTRINTFFNLFSTSKKDMYGGDAQVQPYHQSPWKGKKWLYIVTPCIKGLKNPLQMCGDIHILNIVYIILKYVKEKFTNVVDSPVTLQAAISDSPGVRVMPHHQVQGKIEWWNICRNVTWLCFFLNTKNTCTDTAFVNMGKKPTAWSSVHQRPNNKQTRFFLPYQAAQRILKNRTTRLLEPSEDTKTQFLMKISTIKSLLS